MFLGEFYRPSFKPSSAGVSVFCHCCSFNSFYQFLHKLGYIISLAFEYTKHTVPLVGFVIRKIEGPLFKLRPMRASRLHRSAEADAGSPRLSGVSRFFTPCVVGALRLRDDYQNICTVSTRCHGLTRPDRNYASAIMLTMRCRCLVWMRPRIRRTISSRGAGSRRAFSIHIRRMRSS